MVGHNNNVVEMYLSMFGCKNCMLPMIYLAMPISKVGIWVLSMLGMLKKVMLGKEMLLHMVVGWF
jgi:hypothetical protein